MKYTIKFTCHGDSYIEPQTVLLVASLKEYLKIDYELICIAPYNEVPVNMKKNLSPAVSFDYNNYYYSEPLDESRNFLLKMGCEFRKVLNNRDNPYFNLALSIGEQGDSNKCISLDSDILLINDFYERSSFREVDVNGVGEYYKNSPGGFDSFIAPMEDIYRVCEVPAQYLRIITTSAPNEEISPPNYNIGFIAYPNKIVPELRKTMIWCWDKIDTIDINYGGHGETEMSRLVRKALTSQVAFTMAVHKLGLTYEFLDIRYSYQAEMILKKSYSINDCFFYHYRHPNLLFYSKKVIKTVCNLLEKYPEIKTIWKKYPAYSTIIDKFEKGEEFLIEEMGNKRKEEDEILF